MTTIQGHETGLPATCPGLWGDLPEHEWVRRFPTRLEHWQVSYWAGQRLWMHDREAAAIQAMQARGLPRGLELITGRLLDATVDEPAVLAGLAGSRRTSPPHLAPLTDLYEVRLVRFLNDSPGTVASTALYAMLRCRAHAWAAAAAQPPGTWQQSWARIWAEGNALDLISDLAAWLGQTPGDSAAQAAVFRTMVDGELGCYGTYLRGRSWSG